MGDDTGIGYIGKVPVHSSLYASDNREVLRITAEGEVIWYGKPSDAADVLANMISNLIDSGFSTGMRQRTYIRACRSILSRARDMTKEELIAFLEESINNRISKSVLDALSADE